MSLRDLTRCTALAVALLACSADRPVFRPEPATEAAGSAGNGDMASAGRAPNTAGIDNPGAAPTHDASMPMTPTSTAMPMTPVPAPGPAQGLEPVAIDETGAGNPAGLADVDIKKLTAGGPPGNMKWLYPYEGTVFPRGMIAPSLMWDGPIADVVYLHLHAA